MTINQQRLMDWYHSDHSHLIVTGERGIGKTTLIEWFDQQVGPCDGFRSYKAGAETVLELRDHSQRVVIGRRGSDRMILDEAGFSQASDWIKQLEQSDSDVLILDEIGYMERQMPAFIEAVVSLAQKKRLVIVVRRQKHGLESRLTDLGAYDYLDLNESPSSFCASSADKS